MELEEQQHKPPKKNKLKKNPQRGVGVAQLEKLRCMEKQQRISSIAVSSSSDFSSQGLVFPPPPPATAVMKPQATSNFFNNQQHQHRQPPGFFPMLWNTAIEAKGDAPPMKKIAVPVPQRKQQPLLVDSQTCHRMEPPSSQNNSSSYDLLSCWRSELDKNSVEMTVDNKRPPPPAFHLNEVIVTRKQEAYFPHKHPFLSSEFSPANGSNLIKLEFQAVRGNSSTPFVGLANSDVYIERSKGNGGAHDGSFLTLASVSTPSLLKPFDIPQHYQYDHSDFSLQNSQARKKETVNASSSNELSFYDFLLPGSVRNEKKTVTEIRESPDGDIDLNLRL
ncbi:uncharacterized protein LOC121995241 [Zingiber officinale]|uniref:Uncharacterized protein n=1 Tax=Zingiber officinale TaxID=94328 RepID=A0A8J5G768_ZINOF|nr:uncharacterized protein LOC121995241 [Zingiber officinale]KAG6501246.1 hypothetical protein ZIOFF_041124 [Zingiber officinale]